MLSVGRKCVCFPVGERTIEFLLDATSIFAGCECLDDEEAWSVQSTRSASISRVTMSLAAVIRAVIYCARILDRRRLTSKFRLPASHTNQCQFLFIAELLRTSLAKGSTWSSPEKSLSPSCCALLRGRSKQSISRLRTTMACLPRCGRAYVAPQQCVMRIVASRRSSRTRS